MDEPQIVDVSFPVVGEPIPSEHGIELFESIARTLAGNADVEVWCIHPIRGRRVTDGRLALDSRSFVRIRLPSTQVRWAERLAGAVLTVDRTPLTLGPCSVLPLEPTSELRAELVFLPNAIESDDAALLAAVREELFAMELAQPVESIATKMRRRRLLRVRDNTVVGFAVDLASLEPTASITIQARGMGTRRRYGAGLFLPPYRHR